MQAEQIGELITRLTGDSTQYVRTLEQAKAATKQAAADVGKATERVEGFGFGMRRWALQAMGALAPLAGALSVVGGAFRGVQLAAEMEQLEISFHTLTGSAEIATQTLRDLTRFAAETPFQMPEVVEAAKQMIAFGQEASSIVPTMRMLGDIAAGLNIPLGNLTYLFGTLKSQGRAFTVDINQFAMRGIPIWGELEKILGKTNAEVRRMVEQGQVGFPLVEQAFRNMTGEGGRFGGLMERQSRSLSGLFSTMKDDLESFLRVVGKEIIEAFRLKDVVAALSQTFQQLTEWLKSVPPETKRLVAQFAALAAAIMSFGLAWPVIRSLAAGTIFKIDDFVRFLLGSVKSLALGVLALVNPINLVNAALVLLKTTLKALGIGLVIAFVALLVEELGGLERIWANVKRWSLAAWDWVQPVWRALQGFFDALWQTARQIFTAVRNFAVAAFHAIAAALGISVEDMSIDWERVQRFVVEAIVRAEFFLRNLQAHAEAAWTAVQLGFHAAVDSIKDGLIFLLAFVRAWSAANVSIFTSTWQNIRAIVTGETVNMADAWVEEFNRAFGEASRALGAGERDVTRGLRQQLARQQNVIATSWEEFRDRRLAEIFAPEGIANAVARGIAGTFDAVAQAAGNAGQRGGEQFTRAVAKAVRQADAVLFHSAEALARRMEYLFRVRLGAFRGRPVAATAGGVPAVTASPAAAPALPAQAGGAGGANAAQVPSLLAQIRDGITSVNHILRRGGGAEANIV